MKKELVNELNKYVADLGVAYIKAHNLHWNVVGAAFKQTHEYLEDQYEDLTEKMDAVAEVERMFDLVPVSTMKDFLAISNIKEIPAREFTRQEAIAELVKDIKTLKAQAEKVRALASEEDLYHVVAMMEEHGISYDKVLWFAGSMLK